MKIKPILVCMGTLLFVLSLSACHQSSTQTAHKQVHMSQMSKVRVKNKMQSILFKKSKRSLKTCLKWDKKPRRAVPVKLFRQRLLLVIQQKEL